MPSVGRLAALAPLAALALAAPTTDLGLKGASCPIIFEGRVNLLTKPSDFDKNTSVYNNLYDLPINKTWADVLSFPPVLPSLFDVKTLTKSFEITITNQSVFYPGGNPQYGFRRSELMPAVDTATNGNASTVHGTTTFHWSMRTDPLRPLNYTHEYHPAWHEYADYSSSQFTVLVGKPFDSGKDPKVKEPKSIRVAGLQANYPETQFFETSFDDDVWHNLAITVGWTSNTLTVYYSKGYEPLKKVSGPSFNNNTGGGAFHVGMFKEPTGPIGIDVVHEGYQSPHINEGLIFGGVFIEDSSKGCVTLD